MISATLECFGIYAVTTQSKDSNSNNNNITDDLHNDLAWPKPKAKMLHIYSQLVTVIVGKQKCSSPIFTNVDKCDC